MAVIAACSIITIWLIEKEILQGESPTRLTHASCSSAHGRAYVRIICMCITHRDVCLHMWEHRDHTMDWTMGCPKSFDIHSIFPTAVGGTNMILINCWKKWGGRRILERQIRYFQASYSLTRTYRVSVWPRTILSRTLWEFYLGNKWEAQGGLDRDNPHFYFEFLYQ